MASTEPGPATRTGTVPPERINEADKPFILVLVLLAAIIGLVVWSLHEGAYDQIKDVIQSLVVVLVAGFTLYFKSKAP